MKISQNHLFDWELILMMRCGSNEAYQYLLERYHVLGLKLIGHYRIQKNITHYTIDDLWFLFLDAIYQSAQFYRIEAVTFKTYFLRVFNRLLNNFFNKVYLKDNITIEQLGNPNFDGDNIDLYEIIEDKTAIDPKETIDTSNVELCLASGNNYSKLGELQRKILTLKIKGLTLKEIADELNIDINKVRRVLAKDEDNMPLRKIKLHLGINNK